MVLLCVYQDWKSRGNFNSTWDLCWMFVEFVLRFSFSLFTTLLFLLSNMINIEWKMLTIFWFSLFKPTQTFFHPISLASSFSPEKFIATVQFDFEDLHIVSWDIKIHSHSLLSPAIRHQSIISWCNQATRVECEGWMSAKKWYSLLQTATTSFDMGKKSNVRDGR